MKKINKMSSGELEIYDYLLKYIIIGDTSVGKSNLLLRFVHGQFKPGYQSTIGVEFGAKNVEIRNKTYRIQIWDTQGQENFRSITRNYYKNSACALVVYDITSRDSFNNVSIWIEDCRSQSNKAIFIILVGNKKDLEDKRQVSTDEGKELAEKYGLLFYETSAKTGENVNELFNDSADEIAKKIDKKFYDLNDESCGIKLGSKLKDNNQIELGKGKNKGKKRKCC